ncbi:dihydroxy-acid dehydratase [Mycolicibacterium sp. 624]|uniref:dihydroxy-acid dehydratase n=1 Tax=Mycolicibacterium sp. 624 TaxID=3156314 RepID=UPI00339218E0
MGLSDGLTDYGDKGFARFLRTAFASSMGYSEAMLDRPIVGITWTASDFNNCHRLAPSLVEAVKRGVLANGALPMVFPTASLGESFLTPTSMYFRNLAAMETEELVRGQPMDAVVLIGGCDKTLPAQLMAALSVDKPAIALPVGPMSTGSFEGEALGACTDCRRYWAQYRAGDVDEDRLTSVRRNLAATAGTCPVMGTASTMAALIETMGLSLPGAATVPAVHADRLRIAELTGTVAARLAVDGTPRPTELVTERALDNAVRMLLALGGSTNAVVHLAAIAGRAGLRLDMQRFNELSDDTPVLVNLKPSGSHYMQDLHEAGGIVQVLRQLDGRCDLSAPTVWGGTLRDGIDAAGDWCNDAVIASPERPVDPNGGLVALFGSLAPDGALLKRSAASPELFEKTSRAVVFDSLADMAARIDDPDLDVTEDDALVLQNAGPKAAGMPEAGYLPIPGKLARRGVTDMLRISDARMSGTAYGTIVLHVAPEAAVGGPLGLVRTGDRIRISVRDRTLDLLVSPAELAERENAARGRTPNEFQSRRSGYAQLYQSHVTQAPEGCDFDVCAVERS